MSRSHQSGPIAHGQHWNDAPPLQQIRSQSRSATPTNAVLSAATGQGSPQATLKQRSDRIRDDARLKDAVDRVLDAESRLPGTTHAQLVGRVRSTLDVTALSDEAAEELECALYNPDIPDRVMTAEEMRKGLVEYIRRHAADGPGVIKWASALRNVAENVIVG